MAKKDEELKKMTDQRDALLKINSAYKTRLKDCFLN
jgi:hypothetical protein